MIQQLRRVFIHAISSSLYEFGLSVAAAAQADAECFCPARAQEIPDTVSYNNAVAQRGSELARSRKEHVGLRLRLLDVIRRDDRSSGGDGQRTDHPVYAFPVAAGRNCPGNLAL